MNERLAKSADLEKMASRLWTMKFPRLVLFADAIDRYVDTQLKNKISWLETNLLSLLIVRGGAMPPTKIAQQMLRSKHSMTRLIDDLEEKGFVVRDRAGEDRRVVQIRVTASGLDYMRRFLEDIEAYEQRVLSCLSEVESEKLVDMTKKIRRQLITEIAGGQDQETRAGLPEQNRHPPKYKPAAE